LKELKYYSLSPGNIMLLAKENNTFLIARYLQEDMKLPFKEAKLALHLLKEVLHNCLIFICNRDHVSFYDLTHHTLNILQDFELMTLKWHIDPDLLLLWEVRQVNLHPDMILLKVLDLPINQPIYDLVLWPVEEILIVDEQFCIDSLVT